MSPIILDFIDCYEQGVTRSCEGLGGGDMSTIGLVELVQDRASDVKPVLDQCTGDEPAGPRADCISKELPSFTCRGVVR